MIGCWLKSNLSTVGACTSSGRVALVALIRFSTSMATVSGLVPSLNCTVTAERPSEEKELIWSRPARPATASSTGLVTRVSTTSGLAPG